MPKRTVADSARNDAHTDREILANINDAVGSDGWTTTTEIARACGFTDDGKGRTLATKVASRLSWMRAGGLIESADPDMAVRYTEPGDRDTRWRLTEIGQVILGGKVSKAVENSIERMDPGNLVVLMNLLTKRGYVEAEDSVAFALRRQYQHNIAQRRLVFTMKR